MQTVTELCIYPIKSCKGINQPAALVEEKGLKDDRRYMLVDRQGQFVTGRTFPQLTQIQVEFSEEMLNINAAQMSPLKIKTQSGLEQTVSVQVWNDTLQATPCSPLADQWFSDYLGIDCQLVHFSKHSKRFVKDKQTQVSFADGYPLLLVNQASVDLLNTKLEQPITANHFRPNIVVKGDLPFAEDSWAKIQIGEVIFEVTKPCSRCPFTNVDPKTGIATAEQPLATLASFRYRQGEIDFGQNLVPLNSGIIRQGDQVKVLATQNAPAYGSINDLHRENKKVLQIHYSNSDIISQGDNQQLLLDQAELAGIAIPHSCRGGKCGHCKTKLLEGEVATLNSQALSDDEIKQGYILACSCIPLSDIKIDS